MRRMAIAAVLVALFALPALAQNRSQGTPTRVRGVVNKFDGQTLTPIQHLAVIFQENVSFDHYFGTYPTALNPPGEPRFKASPDTPMVNGLGTLVDGQPDGVLLTHNPNANNPGNGSNAINPFRLDRSQASTCSQDHAYGDEQNAFDEGLMDLFPASVGVAEAPSFPATFAKGREKALGMGISVGNTARRLGTTARILAIANNS